MTGSPPRELVNHIRRHDLADRLLDEHWPDASGHCPLCRSVGCTLFAAAQAAVRLERSAAQLNHPAPDGRTPARDTPPEGHHP